MSLIRAIKPSVINDITNFIHSIETKYLVLSQLGFSPELVYYRYLQVYGKPEQLAEAKAIHVDMLRYMYNSNQIYDSELSMGAHKASILRLWFKPRSPLAPVFTDMVSLRLSDNDLRALARKGYSIDKLTEPSIIGQMMEYDKVIYHALTDYNVKKRDFNVLNPMWTSVHRALLLSFNVKWVITVELKDIVTHNQFTVVFPTQTHLIDFFKRDDVRIACDKDGKVLLTVTIRDIHPQLLDFEVYNSKGLKEPELDGVFITNIQLPKLPLI